VAWGAVLLLRPSEESLIEPDPVDVHDYFSPDDIARARDFGRPQLALQAAASALRATVVILLVKRPLVARRNNRPLLQATTTGVWTSGTLSAVVLPLRALMRRRALAAGLARGPWRRWGIDLGKGAAIESALSGATAAGAVLLMRRWPRVWWLAASGASVGGALLLTFLAPVVLDPIFNRFTVLEDGELRDQLLALAQRAGVEVGEVYRVDASTRTTAANAYVTGLGATKRIVLFDTLLESFTPAQTRLVVAHELAHVRHRDVLRGIAHMGLSAPAAMYATSELLRAMGRHPTQSTPGAQTLPALTLAFGVLAVALGPSFAALSRRVEARADAYALELTGEAEPFIEFERRIVRQNLADPDPPRWLSRLTASHPSAVHRIGIGLAYRARR
jgi:STE24 endopeptidase